MMSDNVLNLEAVCGRISTTGAFQSVEMLLIVSITAINNKKRKFRR